MANKSVRTLFTVAMDVLIVVAVALTVRLVIMFFGQLSATAWGVAVAAFTNLFTMPFGAWFGFEALIKTPYGGVFDINAALTIVTVLVLEWVLSVLRSRA